MVRAVIFDFGNVISAFDPGIFVRRLLDDARLSFEEARGRIYGSDVPRLYETGLISSEEFFARVAEMSGYSGSIDRFREAFVDIFRPIESTSELIRKLKPNYKVGLLSNTNEWHFEGYIRKVDVFPLFDSVTLSFVVKAMKPSGAIYKDALDKLSERPHDCVYIDDVAEYAEGARRAGIHGIRYTGHDDLLRALAALGVRV